MAMQQSMTSVGMKSPMTLSNYSMGLQETPQVRMRDCMIDGQSLIDDTMTVEETELEKTASIDLRRLDFSLPLSPGSS